LFGLVWRGNLSVFNDEDLTSYKIQVDISRVLLLPPLSILLFPAIMEFRILKYLILRNRL